MRGQTIKRTPPSATYLIVTFQTQQKATLLSLSPFTQVLSMASKMHLMSVGCEWQVNDVASTTVLPPPWDMEAAHTGASFVIEDQTKFLAKHCHQRGRVLLIKANAASSIFWNRIGQNYGLFEGIITQSLRRVIQFSPFMWHSCGSGAIRMVTQPDWALNPKRINYHNSARRCNGGRGDGSRTNDCSILSLPTHLVFRLQQMPWYALGDKAFGKKKESLLNSRFPRMKLSPLHNFSLIGDGTEKKEM